MKAPLPLNAINAFAAAGRHGSFLLAGQELGVTPAAVSQLVRKLEGHLGKTLFQRLNNRIILTDAGKSLLQSVSPALGELAEAAERVSRSGTRRRLRVSAVPSLVECWLLPRLSGFLATQPRLRIDLAVEERADARLLVPRTARPHRVAADADDAAFLAQQVQPLRRLLGQADDALRAAHGGVVHANSGVASHNVVGASGGRDACARTSAGFSATGATKPGPSQTKVWNSPPSPQGQTPAGNAAWA